MGKLWSALPLEEKNKYEREAEKQRLAKENISGPERQHVKIVIESNSKESSGKKSKEGDNPDKVNQLAEVPDPYLIFSSEVRGEVVKRNPTLSPPKVGSQILPNLSSGTKGGSCAGRDVEDDGAELQGKLLQVGWQAFRLLLFVTSIR